VVKILTSIANAAEAYGLPEPAFRAKILPHVPVVQIRTLQRVVVSELLEFKRRREIEMRFGGRERLIALTRMATETDWTYLIRAANGLVKIGCSAEPERRFHALSTMSPVALELVALCPGGYSAERYLHDRFREHRSHGEWFREVPEMLEALFALKVDVADNEDLLMEAEEWLKEEGAV
jgi:hypothetical protein